MFFSSGERVVNKDADDLPTFALNTSRAADFIAKIQEFYTDECVLIDLYRNISPIFSSGRALFCGTLISVVSQYKDMETDYGILPLPVYEEEQENYGHTLSVGTTGSLVGMPNVLADADASSFMVEMLCRASEDTLKKAYMDVTVISRGIRDEESYEMLEIILDSRVYDIAYINKWGPQEPNGWWNWLMTLSYQPQNASLFASELESAGDATVQEIQETIDAYQAFFD